MSTFAGVGMLVEDRPGEIKLDLVMDEINAKRAVGNFLKEARLEMDATQALAASETGNSIAKIKQYELGKVMPNLTTAFKLCDFYDVEWEKLGDCIQDALFPEKPTSKTSETDGIYLPIPLLLPSRITSEVRESYHAYGQQIVQSTIEENGWVIINETSPEKPNTNFDLVAKKNGKVIRLKITSKKHKAKTTLCIDWEDGKPSFNQNETIEPADFLVMVRFHEENGSEIFVLPIEEAERKADWMAENLIALGNKPVFLQPYVGGPRNSRFKFNKRKEWEPFYNNWGCLDRGIPNDAPFTSLIINVPDENASPPARSGSDRYKRFCILKTLNGRTIRAYYKACRDAGVPCQKNNPILAHEKGFIILTSPKK